MSKNTQIGELINYISYDGSGNIVFTTVSAATTNTDKFLVSDAGVLKFRTAAQLLSDIGAQASGSYQAALSGTGFVKISGTTISYDNSTYATQTYVGTAISNLVDSSPATLDTLNELAAALGDDPNFATTVATSIGTKQPQLNGTGFVKASGTTVSYDNSTYLTSASLTGYIPYTGATGNVSLGNYELGAKYLIAEGSAGLGGVISIKQDAVYLAKGNGYSSIASSFSAFDFYGYTGASTYKYFSFRFDALTDNTRRDYTLPDSSGTIVLSSAAMSIAGYLPKFETISRLSNSLIYDTGTSLLIGATMATDGQAKLELINPSGPVGLKIKSGGTNGNNTFLSIESSKEWRFLTNRGDLTALNQGDLIIRNNTDGINQIILNQSGATTFSSSVRAASLNLNTGPSADRILYISGNLPTTGVSQFQSVMNGTVVNAATTIYGMYVGNNSNVNVSNSYAIYIETTGGSGTITNKYGIYQASSGDKNYFAGNVGINTTSFGNVNTKLQVNGTSTTDENNGTIFIQHSFSGTNGFGLVVSRNGISAAALSLGADSSNNGIISANNTNLRLGKNTSGTFYEYLNINTNGNSVFSGNVLPVSDAVYTLGSASFRWNHVYTTDLHLSNEGKQNIVDGTWGDWTLQEGENDIFMLNNRSGEKFKIKLEKI